MELERFKVVKNTQSQCNKAIDLAPAPTRGSILCPLNDGRVMVLNINDTPYPGSTSMYYPDCQMEGIFYENTYESTVDQIVFSPFDTNIVLMKWTNGLIGMFHVNKPVAFNYWNTYNYLPQNTESSKSDKKGAGYDEAVAIQWCSKKPCCFYVLTKLGNLVTFSISQTNTDIKCDNINYLFGGESQDATFTQLVQSGSTTMFPMIVREFTSESIFTVMCRNVDSSHINLDRRTALKTLQRLVCEK